MGLGDLWNRTLVYFGIAEEYDEAWDDDGYITEEELEQTYAERPSANVRRLTPRRKNDEFDDWTVSESNALPELAAAPPPATPAPPPPARELQPRRGSGSKRESGRSSRPRKIAR